MHPTCPLCGLRFGSRPLLDLHIREDHRQRGHRDPGDAQAPAARAGGASRPPEPAPTPGGVIHALRHVNDELTRAFEAIIRSARRPQPRPRGQATAAGRRDTAAERADQAA